MAEIPDAKLMLLEMIVEAALDWKEKDRRGPDVPPGDFRERFAAYLEATEKLKILLNEWEKMQ